MNTVRESRETWDVIVIGGGATGLGTAIDAASRGFRTLLVEQADFGQATSSRSTKLIHGGLRYLKQGNVSLVRESLYERALLIRNAPHLVKPLPFVVPTYSHWERIYLGLGLKAYDLLAGLRGIGRSRMLSRSDTLEHLPGLKSGRVKGGVFYYDAQFDDARLAITLAATAVNQGAAVVNYTRVEGFRREDGRINAVQIRDLETDQEITLRTRAVINATGIFTDEIRLLDERTTWPMMRLSRGVHLVLDHEILGGDAALMIPTLEDGRVLFAIPWQNRVVLGTTDTGVDSAVLEPKADEEEIDFLLHNASKYFNRSLTRADVRSVFAGIRPLVSGQTETQTTAAISREHQITVSRSGLVSVAGGKWTTYRKMAEDVVNRALDVSGLVYRPSKTKRLRLHGAHTGHEDSWKWEGYGTDAKFLDELVQIRPEWDRLVHPKLPVRAVEVIWAVRYEMARSVEDVLSRRTRALLIDAAATIEAAPEVARLMSEELERNEAWIESQLQQFIELAKQYCLAPQAKFRPL